MVEMPQAEFIEVKNIQTDKNNPNKMTHYPSKRSSLTTYDAEMKQWT